jgi:hypothetical protein
MPDEITRVDYYMGTIPNKAGEGAKVLAALKAAGVNLVACLGYRKSAKIAEIVLAVAEKAPNPAKAAKQAGLVLGKKCKALLITGEDRVGALAEGGEKLGAAGISVVSLHAVAAGAGRFGALLTVDPKDLKKAAKVLGA